MRIFLRSHVATLAVIVAGACLFTADRPASAQNTTQMNGYPQHQALPNADLRLGVEIPLNSTIKRHIGNTIYALGGDYILNRSGASDQEVVSADYINRSSDRTISK